MTNKTPNPSDPIGGIAKQILREVPDDMQRDLARGVAILKEAGCQQVYVFGSIVEGHVRPDSDIDFAVRGCPAKLFFKLGPFLHFHRPQHPSRLCGRGDG